jgi:pimeloyl-ACP methyl ester carboxylesterase
MPSTTSLARVNGVDFHVEQSGTGEPLILVHGGWGSTARWSLIADDLGAAFHYVAYDRRGHGNSGTSDTPPTRIDQEDDLAGLIETLDIGPAHVVGSSFGGSIALGLAARRPDLVRSVSAHEPPLVDFARDDPHVVDVVALIPELLELIHAGKREQAAQVFAERVAIGPGVWDVMPLEVKEAMVHNADAFAAEQLDTRWGAADLSGIESPVLLTKGDQSPAWFAPVIAGVHATIPQATLTTIAGAGHIPHITHPQEYVELITRFAAEV